MQCVTLYTIHGLTRRQVVHTLGDSTMSNIQLVKAAELCSDSADSLVDSVRKLLKIVPTFPEKVTEQESADIDTGLLNRAIAKAADRFFLRDGDTYTRLTPTDAKKANATKVVTFTADVVMGYTSHQLGQMTTQEPGRAGVVKAFRKAVQTAASNRRTYIENVATRERKADGETLGNTKQPVKPVIERTKVLLANIDKMHATARGKGDPTALPDDVVKAAEAAYIAKVDAYLKK